MDMLNNLSAPQYLSFFFNFTTIIIFNDESSDFFNIFFLLLEHNVNMNVARFYRFFGCRMKTHFSISDGNESEIP